MEKGIISKEKDSVKESLYGILCWVSLNDTAGQPGELENTYQAQIKYNEHSV